MSGIMLIVGTRKGLFTLRSDGNRARWETGQVKFSGSDVKAVAVDSSGGRVLAAVTNPFWGTSIVHSNDQGLSWSEPARDAANAPIAFPGDTGAALADVWQLRFSPAEPGVVYAGTEPAAVFRSADGGETFELVRALWEHPHRPRWQPGGGGQCMHTVHPHPSDPRTLTVALSTGGVYRTTDGGASWTARNDGIRVDFFPDTDPYPDFGQCVHKVDFHPSRPDRFFLQHHGGVYRSDDGAASWERIDEGLPSDFGFPMVVHPHRPDTAYVLPLISSEQRSPFDFRYRVYRTDDAGSKWTALSTGLPDEPSYGAVLRDAMCVDDQEPAGVYFGTRDGSVFASRDEGESWSEIVRHLPDVYCVRAVAL